MLGTLVNRNPKFPKDYLYNDQIISFYQFQDKGGEPVSNKESSNYSILNNVWLVSRILIQGFEILKFSWEYRII